MDEKWIASVDERLVNLNSAQKSADTDLHKLKKQQEKVDKILRGDPERNLESLIEAVNHLKNEVNKFNRIFDKDYLGHGGLQSFITYVYNELKKRDKAQELTTGYKWGFWGMVVAAVIGAVALFMTQKDQLEKWLPKNHPTVLDMKLENAKHPRSHRRRVVVHIVPAPSVDVSTGSLL
jgi:hypothetical protein